MTDQLTRSGRIDLMAHRTSVPSGSASDGENDERPDAVQPANLGGAEARDAPRVAGILAMFFCCLPVGVVSIVYAAKVDPHWRHGDLVQARYNSRRAAQWAIAAVAAWLACLLLIFVLDQVTP